MSLTPIVIQLDATNFLDGVGGAGGDVFGGTQLGGSRVVVVVEVVEVVTDVVVGEIT
jgi:hypothetical protein